MAVLTLWYTQNSPKDSCEIVYEKIINKIKGKLKSVGYFNKIIDHV